MIHGFEFLQQQSQARLQKLRDLHRLRQLRTNAENRAIIDLSHNDYLGLRDNTRFQERAHAALKNLPAGAGASRLLGGEHPIFAELEAQFAKFKGAESALYFSTGFAANESLAQVLGLLDVNVYSDSLNHASIIDGLRASSLPREHRFVYRHNDLSHLQELLADSIASCNIIYTESLFSMDGDFAPLAALADLAREHRGVLVVDEAHATGIYGEGGKGYIKACGLDHQQFISVNTCGKALGVQGGVVCGPTWMRDMLINHARAFIYSTAPSPWSAAALIESLACINTLEGERKNLQQRSDRIRDALRKLGFDTGVSQSHIIPIILGTEERTLRAAALLAEQGILCPAIRPPTVAPHACRLRASIHAAIDDTAESRLIDAFTELANL